MDILSSMDSIEECKVLLKSGVKEIYCGYVREEWMEKFGVHSGFMNIAPNKRCKIKGNITTYDELVEVSNEVKKYDGRLFITLNAFYYTSDLYDILYRMLSDIRNAGVYGVIVTDVAMMKYITEKFPELYLVLSCCNQANNKMSIEFFRNLGVNRITFPRHIMTKDMVEIVKEFPDVDFEFFVLDGRSVYDDGNCKPIHNCGDFCNEIWGYEYYKNGGYESLDYNELKEMYSAKDSFNQWIKCLSAWDAYSKNGWQSVSCGACAVPELIKYDNVKALKIVGRGINTVTKIQLVRIVKKMIEMAKLSNGKESEIEMIKGVFGIPEFCDKSIRCMMR